MLIVCLTGDITVRRGTCGAQRRGEAGQVEVPQLIGMVVADARQAGHQAGVVVVSADVDGPRLATSVGRGSGSLLPSAQRREPACAAGTTW